MNTCTYLYLKHVTIYFKFVKHPKVPPPRILTMVHCRGGFLSGRLNPINWLLDAFATPSVRHTLGLNPHGIMNFVIQAGKASTLQFCQICSAFCWKIIGTDQSFISIVCIYIYIYYIIYHICDTTCAEQFLPNFPAHRPIQVSAL